LHVCRKPVQLCAPCSPPGLQIKGIDPDTNGMIEDDVTDEDSVNDSIQSEVGFARARVCLCVCLHSVCILADICGVFADALAKHERTAAARLHIHVDTPRPPAQAHRVTARVAVCRVGTIKPSQPCKYSCHPRRWGGFSWRLQLPSRARAPPPPPASGSFPVILAALRSPFEV